MPPRPATAAEVVELRRAVADVRELLEGQVLVRRADLVDYFALSVVRLHLTRAKASLEAAEAPLREFQERGLGTGPESRPERRLTAF